MSYEVRFGPESVITFDAIVQQLLERWGEKTVFQFEAKVTKCIKKLSSNPYLFASANREMDLRKCVLHKNCSILFKIYETEVLIVAFWDNRQQPLL
jgi:plasmid stabilization system protein ParE